MYFRQLSRLLMIASLFLAETTSAKIPAQVQDTPQLIMPSSSGKCLEIGGGQLTDGSTADQWACLGLPHQSWILAPVGAGEYYIVNSNSNKCLEIGGGVPPNGQLADEWDCGGLPHQKWTLSNRADDYVQIVNVKTGKCLEIGGGQPQNGATANQWDCNGAPQQGWSFKAQPSIFSDVPTPGDYLGEGKAQMGTFRPSTAQWFVGGGGEFGRQFWLGKW